MSEASGLASRRAALAALRAVDEDGAYSNLAVPAAVGVLADARDRAFASHLAYETLRWQGTLEWALALVLTRPLDDVEPALRRILLLGALGLVHDTATPAHAAVGTATTLARESVPAKRGKGAAGFVNGVLRALARRAGDLPWPDPELDPVSHLALGTAHPAWICVQLLDRLGVEEAWAVLDGDNQAPGLTLRAAGDRDALITELRAAGIDASPGRWAPEAVRAPGADPRDLAAVTEGRATPQDEASILVTRATRVTPGDRVLDLCAGPGGKAAHLAAMTGSSGSVVAIELHEHRAELIRHTAKRLGADIDVRVGDATAPPVGTDERFDVVLLDAPCTGLGTGRRRPEVRWRRTPEELPDLVALQRNLLREAARRVAPGGRLTYSVCTWTREETEEQTAWFAASPEAAALELVEQRQLWPHRDATDGMYLATYRHRGDADRLG